MRVEIDRMSAIAEMIILRDLYGCELTDISLVKEYALREGFVNVYNLICMNTTGYYHMVSNGSGLEK